MGMRRRLRKLGALTVASTALLVAACGTAESPEPKAGDTREATSSSARAVSIPDVVGLSEGEAVKALGAVGLVANVRYDKDAPRTGKVVASDPEAGSELPASSVVVLSIAYGPRLPMPTPEQEQLPRAFSSLIEDNPQPFFGSYRDEDGVLVVVFNPGVDPAAWDDRLTAAAEGIDYPAEDSGYRTDACPRDRKSLRALQDEIVRTRSDWADDPRLAFGVWVQPETCTVRVESDLLTAGDIEALVDRYGTAISFDTSEGAAPRLLTRLDSE
jgi:PASTA domain